MATIAQYASPEAQAADEKAELKRAEGRGLSLMECLMVAQIGLIIFQLERRKTVMTTVREDQSGVTVVSTSEQS